MSGTQGCFILGFLILPPAIRSLCLFSSYLVAIVPSIIEQSQVRGRQPEPLAGWAFTRHCSSQQTMVERAKGKIHSHSPKPLRRHLADGVHIAHVASQPDELDSDRGAFLNHVSRVIGILRGCGVWIVSHIRREMLPCHQHKISTVQPTSPTSFETNTVRGPASQKTPCGLMEETAQSIWAPSPLVNVTPCTFTRYSYCLSLEGLP